jgi:hypothetical protein
VAAQFFDPYAMNNHVAPSDYKDLMDVVTKSYDENQRQTLNQLIAKNVAKQNVTDDNGNVITRVGDLDQAGYMRDAVNSGLSPEAILAGAKYYQNQLGNRLSTQSAQTALKFGGSEPTAEGRAGATVGSPKPVVVDTTPANPLVAAAPTTAAPASSSDTSSSPGVLDKLQSWFASKKAPAGTAGPDTATTAPASLTPDQQAQVQAQQAAPAGGAMLQQEAPTPRMDVGEGRLRGAAQAAMLPPVDVQQTSTVVQPPDNRTSDQAVQDSWDPSKLGGANGSTGADASQEMFTWAPKDDGSNQYQQYSTALDSKLKANGFASASEYLQKTYDATLRASITKPQPNPMLRLQGPGGMVEYQKQANEYQADVASAQGKAQAAVMAERDKLAEFAKSYGVNAVEQRKSDLNSTYTLRDPAKRDEAAALVTNTTLIPKISTALDAANDTTALSLLAPQVARAYATALNPGQQLSEGNLAEVARVLYPEMVGEKLLMGKAILALARGFKNNDWSGITDLGAVVDSTGPAAVKVRFQNMLQEAQKLNETTLNSYVIRTPGAAPASRSVPEASTTAAPAPATMAPTKSPSTDLGTKLGIFPKPASIPMQQRQKGVTKARMADGKIATWNGSGWDSVK